MSVALAQEFDGKVLNVEVSGKLTVEDYQHFVPEFEKLIAEHGKIRLLFVMSDFHGWTAGALWEDLKVDMKHFNHIERLAMVGEKAWEKGMSVFCKPFTTAKVRYFGQDEFEQAKEWIAEGIVAAEPESQPTAHP